MHCDLSPGAADDTIKARDGETDTISCGPGEDTVEADAQDVVAADCEHIDRATAAPGGAKAAALKLRGKATRAALLRGKLAVMVPCAAACNVTVTARAGRTTIATGRARLRAAGTAKVTLRATAKGRRLLRRAKPLRVTVTAEGAAALSVRLK
jgi:hypothetical protein